MRYANRLLLAVVLASACTAPIKILTEDKTMGQKLAPEDIQLRDEGEFPSLGGAKGWINSPPLTPESLRGKVVVVQFWTYTCINWLRTEPYIRAWAEKYKDKGLVVIGAHTPEFEFEKDVDNIRLAIKERKIDYPVAIDSDYKVWNAFRNRYWPALYIVDAKGNIRYHQFGEGEYERSERVIQKLLAEAGNTGVSSELVSVNGAGPEAAPNWGDLGSAENYAGYERTVNFASPGGSVRDKPASYILPGGLELNQWALSGDWTIARSLVRLNKANGRITYRFHARDLHIVMGPAARGGAVRFRVLIDGKPPGGSHGADTDEGGYGTVSEQRMYQLVRQTGPVTDKQFEIEFLDAGLEVFVFTFG